ncbi:sensor histidine kinase [Enterococcus malodoratus]|uniref:sensor histidine kinase n=1 Tax=Enterococcus malodoratus TaxID=71451 RepID=UPI0020735A0A|nr:HAMP domain-containing sensor histidine kinase [Enterococcus malodoratus]
MNYRKNSLTRSFIRRVGIIFVLILLFVTLVYRWGFPTYYYWKMEQPVKEAQKALQNGQNYQSSDDLVVVPITKGNTNPEYLTDDLAFRLEREGISLNRFWVDQTTIEAVNDGRSVQRLYNQTKQKSDFYTVFFSKGNTLYLAGTSIPDFKSAIHTLLPLLVAATILFLALLFGLVIVLVRNQIIKPISRLEQATRSISELNFADSDIQEKNELGSLSHSINLMKRSLQQHELDLLERNERLKNFSSNLAHELKTPLSVMQLLVDGEDMGLENPTFLPDLNQQLEDMNHLVANILAYSQQMQEKLPLETIDIQAFVEKELTQQRLIDPKFQIELHLEPCQFQTNEQLLRMVFINLLTNGMKYSLDNQITITGEKLGKDYQLIFKNKAIQMTDQQIAQLKEPFVVGEESRNNHLSGTGLGLSIVEQTVIGLDGKMTLQQKNNHFIATITLPIKHETVLK